MRISFINTLTELAAQNKDVMLITGDLGFSVFEDFKERFPDQYLNVGVAEQNMISVAAGLALSGKLPFVYSITTFATMRPYEQIRNDVSYQNLPVVIIGGGSTFSYSTFGCTHMPLEDVSIMRTLPGMRVLVPGDPYEVRELILGAYKNRGPAYIRIAKRGEPQVHGNKTLIEIGKAATVREGDDVAIIVSGGQLPNAIKAAAGLADQGIEARVVSMHTIKPIDEDAIMEAAKTKAIVTVEEHNLIGGLASAVAETLVKNGKHIPVKSLGITDEFPTGVGSSDYFMSRYGLTSDNIIQSVINLLK